MRYKHIMVLVCILFFQAARSQNNYVSGNFTNSTFGDLVKIIEAQSSYHFFYDSSDVDSLNINISAGNISINALLDSVFKKTTLHFAIDQSNRIFINNYYTIKTSLPQNFFNTGNNYNDTAANNFSFPGIPQKETSINIPLENKLLVIGPPSGTGSGKATIAGYVKDEQTGEAIKNAFVSVDSLHINANTDQYGYYSITLPKGFYTIKISGAGKEDTRRKVQINASGKLDVEMTNYIATLKDVVVTSAKKSNTLSTNMGVSSLSIQSIKQLPSVLGETDVIKAILVLPGVTSVGEASNGFNVRGGATDQNLILYGDATIYNPTHLFGFFSAFNADNVSNVELYKSTIPEKYGGRLASVLDISVKDGNTKKLSGDIGIGPLTSRVTIEGPIKKDKTSVIASVRGTYSDWLLHSLKNNAYNKSNADFSDASIRFSHIANEKNSFYLSGYISNDKFSLNSDTTYKYSNRNVNFKWKHIFSEKFNGALIAAYDDYKYSVSSDENPVNGYNLGFNIQQSTIRADFNYNANYRNKIDFGVNSIFYKLNPGSFLPQGGQSLVAKNILPTEQALESAVYLGDNFTVNPKLSIDGGIHFSIFNYLGPHSVNTYVAGIPKDTGTVLNTTFYGGGKIISTYSHPEIRLSARYLLSENSSVKLSFNTTTQYIHMLSNTVSISPTDIWKLSDPNILPEQGRQVSLGYYKNFKTNSLETSVEIYYKQIENYLDYKSGANLLLNPHIETDIINSKGKAYGAEFLIKKTLGKLNGWLSYTYSRTFLKTDDLTAGQPINKGAYYPADFDKPSVLNFIGNYRFSHRYSISANMLYSTGRPITLPLAVFNNGGAAALYYSQRNEYRIPDYFRFDFSVNIEGNHKVHQHFHNSWTFGVYNLTARQNAYSVYFLNVNGKVQGYKLSIFGTAIPFVTYNIKF